MQQRSNIYMTLGTILGLAIAIIIFLINFATSSVNEWTALWFFLAAMIGRILGYGLDRIADRGKK